MYFDSVSFQLLFVKIVYCFGFFSLIQTCAILMLCRVYCMYAMSCRCKCEPQQQKPLSVRTQMDVLLLAL